MKRSFTKGSSLIVYLVGPSGVGKSTAAEVLDRSEEDVQILDIDRDLSHTWSNWSILGARLASLHGEESDVHTVVDIGAGPQHFVPELPAFLSESRATVLLIWAPPEEVIFRNPVPKRSPAEYLATEYESRTALYQLATSTVDVTGLAKDEAARKVVAELRALLGLTRELAS